MVTFVEPAIPRLIGFEYAVISNGFPDAASILALDPSQNPIVKLFVPSDARIALEYDPDDPIICNAVVGLVVPIPTLPVNVPRVPTTLP
jgi:hypothetical protein